MSNQRLLLISRNDIVRAAKGSDDTQLFRLLARLTSHGFHLLATAPQPDRWASANGGPDNALLGPESLRERLANDGGFLDGIYYVQRSLLTQKRNRIQALQDMLQRYSASSENCNLLSSSRKFVVAAHEIGIQATHLNREHKLITELKALL